MTLVRQFYLLILTILLVSFSLSYWQNIQSTRNFLQKQMQSHAQDTATSLGVSLVPEMVKVDKARIDTMINAVFDRGYYKKIAIFDKKNQLISERQQPMEIPGESIPGWFLNWIGLEVQQAKAEISGGWSKAGEVIVISHPGYVYRQLWDTAKKNALALIITTLISSLLLGFLLNRILKPLKAVVEQAKFLTENKFIRVEKLPSAPELQLLVLGMNQMVDSLEHHIQRLSTDAQNWQKEAFQDGLTGLPNRKNLDRHITQLQQNFSESHSICFAIFRIFELDQANLLEGYRGGDNVLIEVSNLLKQELKGLSGCVVARLSGPEFALLLRDFSYSEADGLLTNLVTRINSSLDSHVADMKIHAGAVIMDTVTTDDNYFIMADELLNQAVETDQKLLISDNLRASAMKGKEHQTNELWSALDNNEIRLSAQSLKGGENLQLLGQEYFLQIKLEDGQWYSAGKLLPRFSKSIDSAAVDRIIVQKLMQQTGVGGFQMVNIAPQSLLEGSDFVQWLIQVNEPDRDKRQLAVEFSQIMAPQSPKRLVNSVNILKQQGIKIGVDHFGFHADSLHWLTQLHPDYVKLDPAIMFGKDATLENQIFVDALLSVCHSMGIQLFAMGIEIEPQLRLAQHMKFDGFQGFFIDQPTHNE